MIVPGQRNLKVHFAAVENLDQFLAAKLAGVAYMLFSAFVFICEKATGIEPVKLFYNMPPMRFPSLIFENSRHSIMDSGLFTLMFGAMKGQKDEALIAKWQNLLIEFVRESGFKGACVEVDCQKVLSVDHAWRYRRKMRRALPNNRMINVFHIEDGQKGLDRLIEYADYIALSVPELRLAGKKDYTLRLASYIKNKKPEIDIHLLGCTELKMLRQLKFCTSSDSSSWIQIVRYGFVRTTQGTCHIERFKQSPLAEPYAQRFKEASEQMQFALPNPVRGGALTFAAEETLARYTAAAGEQW